MICIAEVIYGFNRYKLIQEGIKVMNELDEGFHTCLNEWWNKYGVELQGLSLDFG